MNAKSAKILTKIAIPAILFAAIFLVYYPSLSHIHRADQWPYLIDTVNDKSFWDLLVHTYSFNRTRVVTPGDVALFRPILFGLLSFEKAVFGNNLTAWQLMGIFLHFITTYLIFVFTSELLKYFVDLKESRDSLKLQVFKYQFNYFDFLPLALSLFFGLNFSIMEAVIWTHINGYVLFTVFVLGTLISVFKFIIKTDLVPSKRRQFLIAAWVFALFSAFTYELGQLFAVLIGALLWLAMNQNQVKLKTRTLYFLSFSAILVIYQTLNKLDLILHRGQYVEDVNSASIAAKIFQTQTIKHFVRFFNYAIAQPFFPSIAKFDFDKGGERLTIAEPSIKALGNFHPILLISTVVFGLAILATILAIKNLIKPENKIIKITLFTFIGTFLLYACVIVLGRMNLRPGPNALSGNCYYEYIALSLLIPILFVLLLMAIDTIKIKHISPIAAAIFIVGIIIITSYSGIKVNQVNRTVAKELFPMRSYVDQVNKFISDRRSESDFSIAFDIYDSSDKIFTAFISPASLGVDINTILFRKYQNNFNPKYVLKSQNQQLVYQTLEEYKHLHPETSLQLFPQFIKPGFVYNIHYYEGKYTCVFYWEKNRLYNPYTNIYVDLLANSNLEVLEAEIKSRIRLYAKNFREAINELEFATKEIILQQIKELEEGKTSGVGNQVLLEEGYKAFNIVWQGHKVYGIPQGEGVFEVEKAINKQYSYSFVGQSVAEVKKSIDRLVKEQPRLPVNASASPQLVEAGYLGFNIVQYKNQFYALSQSLGSINLETAKPSTLNGCQQQRQCFIGQSTEEVKKLINAEVKKNNR